MKVQPIRRFGTGNKPTGNNRVNAVVTAIEKTIPI
nr:MAG TPA: hypothetical protein [Caudoviricetes sp.]